jgi:uncharacterized protein YdeI (YjbR/CyaY-like superfamily)
MKVKSQGAHAGGEAHAPQALPILEFQTAAALRSWLEKNHASSEGIWLRIYRKNSGSAGVAFENALDEGLCFGWSESKRMKRDERSYLQRFTPRRKKGTASARNLEHVRMLIRTKRMTAAGLKAIGGIGPGNSRVNRDKQK